jgi:phage terminase large subunit-like protein
VLADLFDDQTVAEFETLPEHNRIAFIAHAKWIAGAHPYQIPPDLHLDYRVFLMLAGRGAGKTRSAAEALWWWAWTHPNTMSIVLAPTSGDLKFTCFEGPSGLLACIPEPLVTDYNKQDHLIKLSNGSKIRGVSADSYDRLRGINSSFCWCDELAAFTYLGPNEAWDNMMLGLRIKPDDKPHSHPRVIVTTTPRPKDLILDLVGREGDDVVVSRASTYDNAKNLDKAFQRQLESYKGSKLYEQEVLGQIVDLEDGKVVSRDMFRLWPANKPFP